MNEEGRWITTKSGNKVFIKNKDVNDYMNDKIRSKKERRINEHTLEYNGYYIMSPKPNVGYKYETLENAKYYSIYDTNNDDITHNLANWINSVDEAKKHIDNMKKWGIYK